jgi:antitoxin component of RelBE/YafQ-DinJ toxin-antitoxin module
MLKESMNFKIEAELYNKADVVLKGLGTSMSEAVTEYLEQIINKNSIRNQQTSKADLFLDEAQEIYLKWM